MYYSALALVDAVVGNSSSGLYEAPSFETPTVNIGSRQTGRPRAASVIDCPPDAEAIADAIERAFVMDCRGVRNPYGDGHAADQILAVLKRTPEPSKLLRKQFGSCGMRGQQTLVIAEAGVNHNGSIDMALELVDAVVAAGADFVKFQSFNARELASARAPKAEYQLRNTDAVESQLAMLERLQLSVKSHRTIIAHCASKGIRFLSTPFDNDSLLLLTDTLGLDRLKIGSGELTNGPFLLELARSGRRLILSTATPSAPSNTRRWRAPATKFPEGAHRHHHLHHRLSSKNWNCNKIAKVCCTVRRNILAQPKTPIYAPWIRCARRLV